MEIVKLSLNYLLGRSMVLHPERRLKEKVVQYILVQICLSNLDQNVFNLLTTDASTVR